MCSCEHGLEIFALPVGNLAALGKVKIYPNTADNYLAIEGMDAGGKAEIRSIVGHQMLSKAVENSNQTLDVSNLPIGTYMILLSKKQWDKWGSPIYQTLNTNPALPDTNKRIQEFRVASLTKSQICKVKLDLML